jgi:hypothetical protein
VALDGRIEPGDMILEVNGISFENMSNDEAVRTLRETVQRPGYELLESTLNFKCKRGTSTGESRALGGCASSWCMNVECAKLLEVGYYAEATDFISIFS